MSVQYGEGCALLAALTNLFILMFLKVESSEVRVERVPQIQHKKSSAVKVVKLCSVVL